MLLQEDASRKETVKGKFDSEQYARQVRVNIEHYHVNNERLQTTPLNIMKNIKVK